MTDNAPRRIEGLKPRSASGVARLLKSERATPVPPPAPTTADTEAPKESVDQPQPSPGISPKKGRNNSATFYIPQEWLNRGRAAFVHTRNAEGDTSYSHMVAKAYEAEVRRREALYNDGKPFSGGGPLPAGRPLTQGGE